MNMKIGQNRLRISAGAKNRSWMLAVLMAMLILCSGSCVGLLNAAVWDISFLVIAIGYLAIKGIRFNSRNIGALVFFILLIAVNYVLHMEQDYAMYIDILIRISASFCLAAIFSRESFEHYYIEEMVWVSLIGLIVYAYLLATGTWDLMPEYGEFNLCGPFNIMHLNYRNSNIFWEPGAYQFFVNLAIFLLLNRNGWRINSRHIWKYAVLIASVLTTTSATGYMTLAVILGYFTYVNWKRIRKPMVRVFLLVPVLMLLLGAGVILVSSDAISAKITSKNMSYMIRMIDIKGSVQIILEKIPILGLGRNTESVFKLAAAVGIDKTNSAGILQETITMGILYVAAYVGLMFSNLKKYYPRQHLALWVIFILTFFSEDFFYYPIFFIFIFCFQKSHGEIAGGRKSVRRRLNGVTR